MQKGRRTTTDAEDGAWWRASRGDEWSPSVSSNLRSLKRRRLQKVGRSRGARYWWIETEPRCSRAGTRWPARSVAAGALVRFAWPVRRRNSRSGRCLQPFLLASGPVSGMPSEGRSHDRHAMRVQRRAFLHRFLPTNPSSGLPPHASATQLEIRPSQLCTQTVCT